MGSSFVLTGGAATAKTNPAGLWTGQTLGNDNTGDSIAGKPFWWSV